jgi:hypothetical protein
MIDPKDVVEEIRTRDSLTRGCKTKRAVWCADSRSRLRVEESGSSAKGYSKEKVRLGRNSARRLRRAEDFLRLQS